MNEETRKSLEETIPHLICGFREAAELGKPVLFIASQNADGSGKMILSLTEPERFIKDIADAVGVSIEPTEEQIMNYKVVKLLSKFGLLESK